MNSTSVICTEGCDGRHEVRNSLNSCLYEGNVRHTRHSPLSHTFQYRLSLVLIDLDEEDAAFRWPFLWSTRRFSLGRFRREDYLGDPEQALSDCVRSVVREQLGLDTTGPIRLLTQVRRFGYVFNPVSIYYCYDSHGTELEAIVVEVTNTPWGERHCYAVPCERSCGVHRYECHKEFHVSPFMPMAMSYSWRLTTPGKQLSVQIATREESGRTFDAILHLKRRNLSLTQVVWTFVRFPLLAMKVPAAIYWQALRLWWKKVPFFPHPKHQKTDFVNSHQQSIE